MPVLLKTAIPTRVVHVVGRMDRGGVETWLMNLLRVLDPARIRMDIIVHSPEPGAYDDEARALGAKIIPVCDASKPARYIPALYRALRQHGPFDVIHSHVHHFSGVVLAVAAAAGIPRRISHSHNDTRDLDASGSPLRVAYLLGCRILIQAFANARLAASGEAAESLYGVRWNRNVANQILYCGVDVSPFQEPVDAAAVRESLGITRDAFVIGHVGRLETQKNHSFLIDAFAAVHRVRPNSRLLLVGSGSLEPELRSKCSELELSDEVIFAGSRRDVARLMLGAMDCFVFPSLYEGLGLALIEAQAAGLPCIISSVVPLSADLSAELIQRLELSSGADVWRNAILDLQRVGRTGSMAEVVARSPFSITYSAGRLASLYASS